MSTPRDSCCLPSVKKQKHDFQVFAFVQCIIKQLLDSVFVISRIERFHSRGQLTCKFTETKESVYIRKEFNSHRTGLLHQHGRRFIVLEHQYGCRDVMCKRSIIKGSVRVISLSLRLRLITLTSTLIILDITKTSSNNCLELYDMRYRNLLIIPTFFINLLLICWIWGPQCKNYMNYLALFGLLFYLSTSTVFLHCA